MPRRAKSRHCHEWHSNRPRFRRRQLAIFRAGSAVVVHSVMDDPALHVCLYLYAILCTYRLMYIRAACYIRSVTTLALFAHTLKICEPNDKTPFRLLGALRLTIFHLCVYRALGIGTLNCVDWRYIRWDNFCFKPNKAISVPVTIKIALFVLRSICEIVQCVTQ